LPLTTPVAWTNMAGMITLDDVIARAQGVTKLARIAGVSHSTVAGTWRRTGRVPVERARQVSNALNIPLHELRPDIWEPPGCASEKI
jgi:DNA-binding phage protein